MRPFLLLFRAMPGRQQGYLGRSSDRIERAWLHFGLTLELFIVFWFCAFQLCLRVSFDCVAFQLRFGSESFSWQRWNLASS